MKIEARFWAKADVATDVDACWQWMAARQSDGYGSFWSDGKAMLAHKFSYATVIGEVPAGMELDHVCRNRACVNPYHLEPVVHAENMRRGEIWLKAGAYERARTHCPSGHEYDSVNTYVDKLGKRHCRPCYISRGVARRAAKKIAA